MRKICGLFVFIFSLCTFSFAQNSGGRFRISLLTCAPGDELYSIFGHTALRITDSAANSDLVYNYGTFNFDDPDFYSKFVRGKLDYSLSVASFPDFISEFQATHRDVTEQVLNLSDIQRTAISNALRVNMEGSNRYYKYDFLRDNCTSRVRNLLLNYGNLHITRPLVPAGTSYRNLIHEYLDRSNMNWTKLGMDLLMGAPADQPLSIRESMFLPDYLMHGADSSGGLVAERQVMRFGSAPEKKGWPWPLITLSFAAAFILIISFSRNKKAVAFTRIADTVLYLITGLIGCLLLFTWFGTDHASFKSNYNLFWALPTNLPAALLMLSRPALLRKYFVVTSLVYGLLLISWYWLPQQLNPALVPLVLLLFLRSVQRLKP
ncbi:MAG: DUF4105 domain-containing protein [Chitinophagaceae bacterium]|nr:DUF4105 domain-containing protein [Chitinophagaceae bacterium]